MSEKQKIVGMTDHSTRTGFGLVMHNILAGLSEFYDTYFIGWGFHSDEPTRRGNYTLLSTANHPFGADVLPSYLMQLRPEVLIVQADSRMVDYLPGMLKQIPNKPTWIFYPVIDGYVWDSENKCTKWAGNWTAIMKEADKLVAMTEFGQKVLKANGLESQVIYHGVDTNLFKPFPPEAKNQIKENLGLKDKFIVGGVFKNIQRKNPEKYLQSFCLFRKGKESKVALLLHTSPNREAGGEMDLIEHCADYGLLTGKDVFFTQQGVPPQQMPAIFNAMDVYLHLGTMEGFGLPIIEAMSCAIPVVASNASTSSELLGGTGTLVEVPTYPKSHGMPISFGSYNGIECPVPNPYDVAEKLQKLYIEPQLRKEIGLQESERACKVFDWSIIRKQWVDLVKSCIVDVSTLPEEWARIYNSIR